MNISKYKIHHNKKENILKLTKNKSNISNLSIKNNNTINNNHQNSYKKLIIKRRCSHTDLISKEDIANKINIHLEEKFTDLSDKIEKNINESLLKPLNTKIKKIMKKNLKQVRNSLKKWILIKVPLG